MRRPPRYTRTATLLPSTTLCRSGQHAVDAAQVAPGLRRGQVLPLWKEPAQHLGLDGLGLLAEPGQGAAPQLAQHLGLAPLVAGTVGAELTLENATRPGQSEQRLAGHLATYAAVRSGVDGRERTGGAGNRAAPG